MHAKVLEGHPANGIDLAYRTEGRDSSRDTPEPSRAMYTRDFLDQAVLLTAHFEVVVTASQRPPERALQHFWVASRSRFDCWGLELRQCTDQLDRTNYAVDQLWLRWTPLMEEILISEIVTRVWSYLLEALDERLGIHEYSPIGQSAFRGHIDARRRVLNLILRGRQRGLPAVWRLNRQRMNAERWTDLLLGQVHQRDWVSNYAFDLERVRGFGGMEGQRGRKASILTAASRVAFADAAEVPLDHIDMHTRMHAAMLGMFWAGAVRRRRTVDQRLAGAPLGPNG